MAIRTPTEIFEEVLDMLDPLIDAAAYREEFRVAMGPGGTVHGRMETVERAPFFIVDEDDAPAEPTASAEEAFNGTVEPAGSVVRPPRVGPGDHLLRPMASGSGQPPLGALAIPDPDLMEALRQGGVWWSGQFRAPSPRTQMDALKAGMTPPSSMALLSSSSASCVPSPRTGRAGTEMSVTPITDPVELAWCDWADRHPAMREQGESIASFKAGAEWQRAACADEIAALLAENDEWEAVAETASRERARMELLASESQERERKLREGLAPVLALFEERAAAWDRMRAAFDDTGWSGPPPVMDARISLTAEFEVEVLRDLLKEEN